MIGLAAPAADVTRLRFTSGFTTNMLPASLVAEGGHHTTYHSTWP